VNQYNHRRIAIPRYPGRCGGKATAAFTIGIQHTYGAVNLFSGLELTNGDVADRGLGRQSRSWWNDHGTSVTEEVKGAG
jgi:hypothetical protein